MSTCAIFEDTSTHYLVVHRYLSYFQHSFEIPCCDGKCVAFAECLWPPLSQSWSDPLAQFGAACAINKQINKQKNFTIVNSNNRIQQEGIEYALLYLFSSVG